MKVGPRGERFPGRVAQKVLVGELRDGFLQNRQRFLTMALGGEVDASLGSGRGRFDARCLLGSLSAEACARISPDDSGGEEHEAFKFQKVMFTAAYGHTPLYSDSSFENVDPLRTELCVGPGYPRIHPYSALGPLQSMAATGNMGIDLSPAPEGTKLEATYAVVG